MTTHDWPTVRTEAIRAFGGDLPHPETEDFVVEVFRAQPVTVLRGIRDVAGDVAAGKVRSGWAVLRKRLEAATQARSDVRVSANELQAEVAAAEGWIRNAGLHFDRERELLDELFGERGRLRDWKDDEALRERLLTLWRDLRPSGEWVEREEEEER